MLIDHLLRWNALLTVDQQGQRTVNSFTRLLANTRFPFRSNPQQTLSQLVSILTIGNLLHLTESCLRRFHAVRTHRRPSAR